MTRLTLAWCALLVLAAVAGAAGPGAAAVPLQQDGADNSTQPTRHENPNEASGNGDMSEVERYLVNSLSDRLGRSAVQLSEGEYESARRILGDRYDSELGRLVEITGETNTTRTYERTRENQREVARGASRYNRTLERYREAREEGNETRARQLARELQRISGNVNENAGQATEGYDRLGSQTGQNFSTASRATMNVAENISERQAEVREASFVGTTLDVEGGDDDVSFTDPITISGDLSTENGTAVADEEIRLRVGNRTYDATTDGDGDFEIEYRPTLLSANASELRVEYLPERGSPYFNSTDSIPISIEQVEPNVTVERRPDSASLGTNVTVAGRVSVGDRGVRVPVAIRIGDEIVARGMPADDGSFATTVRLPMDVPAGEQPVVALASLPGRAIAPGNATTTIAIEPTNTSLAINGSRVNESAVAVDGRLTTGDGRPIVNETVLLGFNGTATTEVRTDENGTFSETIRVPESRRDNATLVLGALFDAGGTNLESAEAKARIELVTAEDWLTDLAPVAVGAALIGALGLGVWYVLRRRREESDREGPGVVESVEERDEEPREPTESAEGTTHSLERARELIDRGETNEGVVAAYLAVRERLAQRDDVDEGRTHWEFYAESADRVSDDEADSLRSLTRAYERAAFAPGRLSDAIAERVLDDAGRFGATNEETTAD